MERSFEPLDLAMSEASDLILCRVSISLFYWSQFELGFCHLQLKSPNYSGTVPLSIDLTVEGIRNPAP